MEYINKYLSGAAVPISLTVYAIFFLIKLKGRPITRPFVMMRTVFKKGKTKGVSPLRAVIFALAGTLGVGNIVGVASAIALGGAGAVFWMWVSAFLAMILKYGEVVLAVLHRRQRNGENYGGAMYYMKDYFNSCQKVGIGSVFTFLFAVLCLCNGFSMGCIIQTNAIAQSFHTTFNIPMKTVGILLSVLSFAVFFLNGKRIFSLCEKLVPLVSLLYITMSCVVIFNSLEKIPSVFQEIFKEAFSLKSVGAGGVGFLFSNALRYGTIRGLFSNEAGCGTAPIAHAASNTDSPSEQGFLGVIEVFIDTIVVCTMTALVILINRESAFAFSDNPIMMAFSAFSATLGEVSDVLLSISVFLFAFATIVCWGYYGRECIYFFNKGKKAEWIYYLFYIAFVYLGSYITLGPIWEMADFAVGMMTLMNLFVLGRMSREIKSETEGYFKKSPQKRAWNIKEGNKQSILRR